MEESETWVKKWLRDAQNRHSFSMSCDETSSQSEGQRSSVNERSSRSEVRCHASNIHRSTLTRHARHSLLLFLMHSTSSRIPGFCSNSHRTRQNPTNRTASFEKAESLILRTCFELPFLKSLFDLVVYLLHSLRAIQRSVSDHERSIRFPFPPHGYRVVKRLTFVDRFLKFLSRTLGSCLGSRSISLTGPHSLHNGLANIVSERSQLECTAPRG
jgi:hypothetical protein